MIASVDRARETLLIGLRLSEVIDVGWFATGTGVALVDALNPLILSAPLPGSIGLRATPTGRRRLDGLLPRLPF